MFEKIKIQPNIPIKPANGGPVILFAEPFEVEAVPTEGGYLPLLPNDYQITEKHLILPSRIAPKRPVPPPTTTPPIVVTKPDETPEGEHIAAARDTFLKQAMYPAKKLAEMGGDRLAKLPKGTKLAISDIEKRHMHLLVTLKQPIRGKAKWFVYQPHVLVVGTEADNNPQEDPEDSGTRENPTADLGPWVQLGLSNLEGFHVWGKLPGAPNFTYAEAFHIKVQGNRVTSIRRPEGPNIIANTHRLAPKVQAIRDRYGRPMRITSWFRPRKINDAVGGAVRSQHLTSNAVDAIVQGVAPSKVYSDLNATWTGGLGNNRAFTHCDNRTTGRARFAY